MNGDQPINEILRAVGSLEGTQKELISTLGEFRSDLKTAMRTCQSFEEYAKAREDFPTRITTLEKVADEYIKSKPDQEEQKKYIASLRTTIRACIIAAGFINAVMLALIGIMTWMFHSGYLRIGP
jgi:hypothetical protein